ncbi:alpha/beta fold hydrolase [Streptomyces sp. NPDC059740]|uniref:alpha/beta fold hydrolase n=1 Tax=Streptomyces sp. NPDC059740 TaxID=3346926 RepID=UPI00365B491D
MENAEADQTPHHPTSPPPERTTRRPAPADQDAATEGAAPTDPAAPEASTEGKNVAAGRDRAAAEDGAADQDGAASGGGAADGLPAPAGDTATTEAATEVTAEITAEVTAGLAPVPGGGELFYEVAGDGPAVVLLHGGMLDNHMWDEQFAWLSRSGHRVVRYDARGHGLSSDIKGDYAHHEDLRALLAHLGISRAVLVGLSHGARVALDTALTHPEVVAGLALASPGISGRAFTDPFLRENIRQQVAHAEGPHAAEWYVEHFLRMWVDGPHRQPGAVDPALRERLRDTAEANAVAHPEGFSAGVAREADAWSHLTELDVPTLVLDGDLDVSDISANAHAITLAIPGAHRVRVPAAAHMVNLENPQAFDEALRTFLARLTG